MYTPRAFAETDLTGLDRLIERDAFVTLVTVADGLPLVSHLPVLYARDGDRIVIDVHELRLDLVVDDAELEARKVGWTPNPPRYTQGVLGKYARLVQGAETGAITNTK